MNTNPERQPMNVFELEDMTSLKLVNVSPRKECHGEELVQAIDLSLRMETSNESLSMFDGALLSALYFNAAAENGQEKLDGVASVLPNLRCPKLGMPLKWEFKGTGYTMRIDHGLGGKSDLVLLGCKVDKVKLEAKEGGTVVIDFMVQANTDISEKIVGKLCALEGTEIDATLLAPTVTDTIDGTTGHPAAAPKPDDAQRPLEAGDAFAAAHGQSEGVAT